MRGLELRSMPCAGQGRLYAARAQRVRVRADLSQL